jgi:hypothetical protein
MPQREEAHGTVDGIILVPTRLWIDTDCDVVWEDMRDGLTGEWLVDATVTMEVKDTAGVVVIAQTTLDRDHGTIASYHGTLDRRYTALLTAGNDYDLEITCIRGPSTGFRRIRLRAARYGSKRFLDLDGN